MTLPPTRVRYSVLALLCLLAMITYIDRAVIGSAKGDVMAAVGRPAEDFFWLLVAFQLAYALFEVPAGWMGDVFGPRGTLLRIVVWWSTFVALTGLAGYSFSAGGTAVGIGFTSLVVVQFLFGMGEAGAFPNISRALYNWFPLTSRGFAQGAVWMSARFMGGLTPLLWLTLSDKDYLGLDWRTVFWGFAGVAVLWCVAFGLWFRNHPDQHPAVNEAERELVREGKSATGEAHSGVPWGTLLRQPNLWMICGMYFCINFGWYFLMYFLPGFLKEQYGRASQDQSKWVIALLGGGPLLLGMAGCYLGGLLTDGYVRRTGDRKWGRRLFGVVGFAACSLCYVAAIAASLSGASVWAFAGCVMLVGFFNDLTMASAWATCQDVGRRYAAIVSGFMNMIGNLGATLTNYTSGKVIKGYTEAGDQNTGYVICLSMYAAIYFIGVLFWLRIDATRPLVPDEPAHA